MNISGIEATPCSIMDRYDLACKELHQYILTSRAGDLRTMEKIRALQARVVSIRNEIAEELFRLESLEK